jgi:GMP synthase (glutamine-hydrolysing)
LAKALGGVVDYHPQAPEIGCFTINILAAAANDPLFAQLPAYFNAHLTHHQSVIVLPNNAVLLANNAHEPHQAFRVGPCAWGVQFHPEYSKTVMLEYIEKQRAVIARHQQNCDAIKNNTEETLVAQRLLVLFVEYCFKSLPTSLLHREEFAPLFGKKGMGEIKGLN